MIQNDDLASARYALEHSWETLTKQDREAIRANVRKVMDVALRRSEWDLHEKACAVQRLVKEQDAWLKAKRQRTPFERWDRVRLTKRYNGYVKGTVAEVDVYDSFTGTCNIRIQADHVLLRGVPANILTLL